MSARKKTAAQLELPISQHGGKRLGAGRKKRSIQANHVARPRIKACDPLHITMKIRKGFGSLREANLMRKSNEAFERAKLFGLRVVHFTLQLDHIHLICEADSNVALERGIKSLSVTLAVVIAKISGATGQVFADRFHLHVLKSPTEVKYALRYLLFNWAKHLKVARNIDPYSSVYFFKQLTELIGAPDAQRLQRDLAQPPRWINAVKRSLSRPSCWLLSKVATRAQLIALRSRKSRRYARRSFVECAVGVRR